MSANPGNRSARQRRPRNFKIDLESIPKRPVPPDRRARIAAAAIEEFSTVGYRATSVRRVAKRANVPFSLIRFYFGSKANLRQAVETAILEQLDANAGGTLDIAAYRYLCREASDSRGGVGRGLKRLLRNEQDNLVRLSSAGVVPPGGDQIGSPLILMFVSLGPVFAERFVTRLTGRSLEDCRAAPEFRLAFERILSHAALRPMGDIPTPPSKVSRATRVPRHSHAEGSGRERLLRSALRLFAQHGFAGTTLRAIAADAGVTFALVRIHFGSKDDFRRSVDRWAIRCLEQALITADIGKGSEGLLAAFQIRVDVLRTQPHLYRYLRRSLLEGTPASDLVLRRYFALQRRICEELVAIGALPPDCDRLWTPLIAMFVALGPLVLEDFITRVLGKPALGVPAQTLLSNAARRLLLREVRVDFGTRTQPMPIGSELRCNSRSAVALETIDSVERASLLSRSR